MGLGKTVQVIVALRVLVRRGSVRNAVIVCPAGLVLQWRRHLRQWAPDLPLSTVMGTAEQRRAAWAAPATVFVTSYEALRADMSIRDSYGPGCRAWDTAVIDEAQRINNPADELGRTSGRESEGPAVE